MINGSGDRASQIVKSQAYNAFGEIISETDGNGNTSSLSYNTMGKLTKKVLPTVDIRKSDGTVTQGTPTLEYGYDLSGRLLTSKDANGNINKQSYLNGRNLETGDWLVEKETHADTGEVSNLYDVYGNLIEQSNALGVKTGYSYDINGNLVQITRAARTTGTVGANHITSGGIQTSLIDTFTYDELGNRLTATNALKNTTTTDYDALGRVVQSKTAEGVTTKVDYVYDASISNLNSSKGGIRRTETDGLGKTVVDEQDYFGRTIKHTDKGAHVFTYTYNAGGWLTKQTNSQGQSIDYSYYSNGSIKEIRDTALNLLTSYRYDNNGNRIEERYQDLNAKTGELRVFQNALINYDSLNRKISVQDQSFNIHYEYDGNGNIVHMLANYRDAVNAAPKIQDFWYSYDSMNRFTISMGVLNSTTKKVERGNTGIAISYDKLGQRLTADYGKDALNSTKAHKESYSYTTDGYLETVKNADYSSTGILGTQYTVSTRYNDALGRVTKYTDNNENSDTVYQTTTTTYSKDNQITEQKKEGGNGAGTTKYTYLADKVTLDKTVMTPTSGSIQTTQYAYEWWDSAKQSKITTTVDGLKGETSLSYNINGHLTDFVDDRNTNNRRVATYINNSQGMVLQRNELINDSINRYRNFYYVNGQRVGDLSNDGPTREDYVQNLQNNRATATQAKDFKPISSADFDQNFEPINAQYPSSASTSYVVNNGDTLQSIALSVWGDASMWYMLADVNGLSATDKLTAGQVLTVPNKVTNIHNNSETFRPYNPGDAIGNTQPTVPSPPPPPKPKKKCGGIAQIIMIVVAVVVTVVVSYFGGPQAGAAVAKGFTALGASASTAAAAGTVATAATAAAAGSVASQLAGKAMGVVDSFSWTQVGISALSAGITAGVVGALAPTAGTAGTTGATATQGSWVTTAKEAIEKGGWVAKGIVSGVTSYGSNYIANQVFGNNQSFSWASLGSSIVSSIVAAGMGEKGVFDVLGKAASPYAYSLAGANAAAVIDDKWFGGAKPNYLNVSMAAIANTVGRQFGGYISNKLSDPIVVKAQELKPEEILVNNENDFLNIELAGVSDTDKNNFVERFKSDEFMRELLFGDKGLITLSNDEQRTNLINANSNYQKHQQMIDGMFDSAENLKTTLGYSAGSDGSTGYFSYGGENRTQVIYGNTLGMTLFENASLVKQGIDTFVNQTGIDVEKLSLAASIVMFGPAAVAKDYALNGIINYFVGDQIATGMDTLTLGMTAWAYSSDLSLMRSGISAENFALAKAGLNDSSALVREESQAAIYRREGILKNQQGAGDLLAILSLAAGASASAYGMMHIGSKMGTYRPDNVSSSQFGGLGGNKPTGTLERGNININIEGGVPDGYAGHHLIGVAEAKNYTVMHEAANNHGYNINRGSNGIALPRTIDESRASGLPLHSGRHLAEYTEFTNSQLERLQNKYDEGSLSNKNFGNEIKKIEDRIRKALLNNEVRLQRNDPNFEDK
ncbi:AHH domain-containing protein [Acinetobacter baumannii]|uniref:AHH domain-containing protein n=2 Tax=Acinetobacter TaxID=469 RepID=UPI003B82303A